MSQPSAASSNVGHRRGRELGKKFFARTYDPLIGGIERAGLCERRHRLLRELSGDILEVGAGTGLKIPHYEHAARLVLLEPDRHMPTDVVGPETIWHQPSDTCACDQD